jgi:hypothetical protein
MITAGFMLARKKLISGDRKGDIGTGTRATGRSVEMLAH